MKKPVLKITWKEVRFPRYPKLDHWCHQNQWYIVFVLVIINLGLYILAISL